MAEKKKQKPAAFAQEKKTFTGEIPKKANEGKGKKSAAYQPRDADTTSGHDVQRSKNTKKWLQAWIQQRKLWQYLYQKKQKLTFLIWRS